MYKDSASIYTWVLLGSSHLPGAPKWLMEEAFLLIFSGGLWKAVKQVRSDNDASELDILGHIGTFWENLEDFLMGLEHLDSFPSHFSHNLRTHRRMDGQILL